MRRRLGQQLSSLSFLTSSPITMSELYFPSLSAENNQGDGPASTAELQGALCGLLCINAEANRLDWYKTLYDDMHPDEKEGHDLIALFDQTIQSLNSLDFDLQLALPDDDAPLSSRILAMADWSHGLVYGLGVSGLTDEVELSEDAQEYLADVIKISQINDDGIEDSNEEETNFEELTEYLRMGLFLLFNELQPANPDDITTSH